MSLRASFIVVLALVMVGCASVPADSEYNLGVHAYQTKNFEDARVHWERAVAEGEVLAKNNLGYLLYYGKGGPKDRERAVALWREAAAGGSSESLWHLGTVYESGGVVPQSSVEAYAWYRCALASAEAREQEDETEGQIAEDARRSLGQVLARLTPEELSNAQALANEYIAKYARAPSKT
jgi:hypothetical protein